MKTVSVYLEEKQKNGRYKPMAGVPVTDPATVYKSLAVSLYRHSLNRHCNRIQARRIDDTTMQFIVTYGYDIKKRAVYTVENIGFR